MVTIIETERKKRGLSRKDLGDLVGVTRMTISYWERGIHPPSGKTALRLSTVLNVPIEDLINLKGE